LSNNHSEHSSHKQNQSEEGTFLPPRYTKHGKRNDEEMDQEIEREKSFPLIQIILYAFLALIAAFLIYWFWHENQSNPSTTAPTTESQEESPQEDEGDTTTNMGDGEDEQSKETDSDLNETSKNDMEESKVGETEPSDEESGEGIEQDPQTDEASDVQNPTSPEQAEESPSPDESSEEPTIIAEHIVQSGETLYSITMKYYHSKKYMDHLAEYNGIKDIRNIETGTKLIIPEKP
jgi:cytoskeletal protein RodZ